MKTYHNQHMLITTYVQEREGAVVQAMTSSLCNELMDQSIYGIVDKLQAVCVARKLNSIPSRVSLPELKQKFVCGYV